MEPLRAIAVDFDGCLCENKWPEIGAPIPETIERMKLEQSQGTKFILWTCREGYLLEAALEWCNERGIIFDAINEPLLELRKYYGNDTRKIFATEYWDDRAVAMPGDPLSGLNAFAEEVHKNAVNHGWWEKEREFPEVIALCHSELSEALEEYRSGNPMVWYKCHDSALIREKCSDVCFAGQDCTCKAKENKPEGIAVEMADCIIRILDWCDKEGIDIEKVLRIKHEYNLTRPL